ncbi:UNVERIFIED_CONTAM: Zinc finger CCCH domain-containing protein 49 [Sesamum radiatum]|uniref:Zinc finger CCCH domain-containing protein 49 n=1 Tax=Sesamum radiatum TaxID=300843 RepID=A0AAW2UAY1_SESRA
MWYAPAELMILALKLLNKAGEMPSLEPPEDESIRTLYVGGLDARVTEQDLRDNFYAHGEIESVKMVLQRACAFVTYTTREGAEKAAEELANKLVIKGLRLKLLWGKPQVPKPEAEGSDEAKQQAAVAHSGLPRAVISQQQNQPLQPPGTQTQPPPMPYFNIPPLPQQDRAYYPSMDPQRMGALVPSQEGAPSGSGSDEGKSGSEQKQPQAQHYGHPGMPPLQVSSTRHIIHRMGICRLRWLHLINSTLSRINLGCLLLHRLLLVIRHLISRKHLLGRHSNSNFVFCSLLRNAF